MIMAVAMIISVIPFPEAVSCNSGGSSKDVGNMDSCQFNINRFRRCEAASVKGGKLTNDTGDTIQISGTADIYKKDSDFLANNGVSLDIPVVEGAKTVRLQSYLIMILQKVMQIQCL